MNKPSLQLNDQEMRDLAEMAAMVLALFGTATPENQQTRVEQWHKLCVKILGTAKATPSIAPDMEMNPDCGYYFFKRPYLEKAFFEDCLDEFRDSTFWSELVTRLAEQSLMETVGEDTFNRLSEEQRRTRCASMEKALWNECMSHGIDRLVFMLPPEES